MGSVVPRRAIETGRAAAGFVDFTHVRNTGTRPGSETIQVYAGKPHSTITRPPRWLAGWTIVTAQPGEEAIAHIPLPARAFQHWADGAWRTEPGSFTLHIGQSSRELPLTVTTQPGVG